MADRLRERGVTVVIGGLHATACPDEALEHGFDGWMEDFGEYTPLDAVDANGTTGTEFHNRYVRDYHCGAYEATMDAGKPLARFVRSAAICLICF